MHGRGPQEEQFCLMMLGQAPGKVQAHVGRGESQSQSHKHFVAIDQWGQIIELIIDEVKIGNWEGLRLTLSSGEQWGWLFSLS